LKWELLGGVSDCEELVGVTCRRCWGTWDTNIPPVRPDTLNL